MTEHTTYAGIEPDDATSTDVGAIVSDALTPPDRSLSVALCRTGAELAHESRPDGHDALETAVTALEAYVSLRARLLFEADAGVDRDVAILASDYLYARAHAALADGSLEEGRHLELSRLLTRGSCRLARSFLSGDDRPRRDFEPNDGSRPAAVLAGIAGELGSAAAGVSPDAAVAMGRYGCSLAAAVAANGGERLRREEVITALTAEGRGGRDRAAAAEPTRSRDAPRSSVGELRNPYADAALEALAALEAAEPDGALDRETIGRLKYATVVAVRQEERR